MGEEGGKGNDQCGEERMELSRVQHSTAGSRPGERSPGAAWSRGEK